MGIFSKKEEYSREQYEEIERERMKDGETLVGYAFIKGFVGRLGVDSFSDKLAERINKANEKLAKLKEVSYDEALELNEQYNQLQCKVATSLQDLETFEREKLGMHQEEGEEEIDFSKSE